MALALYLETDHFLSKILRQRFLRFEGTRLILREVRPVAPSLYGHAHSAGHVVHLLVEKGILLGFFLFLLFLFTFP